MDHYRNNDDPIELPESLKKENEQENNQESKIEQEGEIEEIDYYSVLHLDRDCSPEQLKSSYKKLSMIFHPDKLSPNTKSDNLNRHFQKIQEAYEVLSDPQQRQVYNLYGSEGLKALRNKQVGFPQKSEAELKLDLEVYRLKKKQSEIEELLRKTANGKMEFSLDCCSWFSEDAREIRERELGPATSFKFFQLLMPQFQSLQLQQSTTLRQSEDSEWTVTGLLQHEPARSGHSGGTVLISNHRSLSLTPTIQPQLSTTIGFGQRSFLTVGLGCPVGKFMTHSVNLKLFGLGTMPVVGYRIEHILGKHTTGYLEIESGMLFKGQESMELGIRQAKKNYAIDLALNAKSDSVGTRMKYTFALNTRSTLNINCNLNTLIQQSSLSLGLYYCLSNPKNISSRNQLGCLVEYCLDGLTLLKFKYNYYSQQFTLPLLLSDQFTLPVLVWSLLLPTMMSSGFWYLYLKPKQKRLQYLKTQKMKLSLKDKVQQDILECLETRKFMISAYQKSVAEEKEKRSAGLIIEKAFYGHFPSDFHFYSLCDQINNTEEIKDLEEAVDVRMPLQIMIQQAAYSQLLIPRSIRKKNLIGFCDPCPWREQKKLYLQYRFGGMLHRCIVWEKDALSIPQRAHLL